MLMSFETWKTTISLADKDERPQRDEARHLVVCLYNNTVFHLMHDRSKGVFFLSGDESAAFSPLTDELKAVTDVLLH
jgi:hypothetical protein